MCLQTTHNPTRYARDRRPVLTEIATAIGISVTLPSVPVGIVRNRAMRTPNQMHKHTVDVNISGGAFEVDTGDMAIKQATELLSVFYEPHSRIFWHELNAYVTSTRQRVTFVGTFGEF